MPLTDRQIKNVKPADKAYKLADGGGLYLQVTLRVANCGGLIAR